MGMHREKVLESLSDRTFDIAVIGGGATGCGIALDAASRGLSVALVERGDVACGTSSRSTKLLHGGVRYLELAVKQLDPGQFHLVKEALHERSVLLRIAPHLTRVLELLTPLYSWWQIPYYTSGLKLYDLLAGASVPAPSRYIGRNEALRRCPTLKANGLRGAVVYSDGQFDDARMCLGIAMRAAQAGARLATYTEVVEAKRSHGKLSSLTVRDVLTGKTAPLKAKVFINATGPYVDHLRKMADPKCEPMLRASSGSHITLPSRYSSKSGLLIPKTDDGRVLFVLPWLGYTLAGTTDQPAQVTDNPEATEEDIQFILTQLGNYLADPPSRAEVLSSWCGLRPLVDEGAGRSTAKLSRDHHLERSESGLITITGGKWTTYRRMAQDAVDRAIESAELRAAECTTDQLLLPGAAGYRPDGAQVLAERYGISKTLSKRLYHNHGTLAEEVLDRAKAQGFATLISSADFLRAEVEYALEHEMAWTADDILDRRLRVGFLDQRLKEELRSAVTAIVERHHSAS